MPRHPLLPHAVALLIGLVLAPPCFAAKAVQPVTAPRCAPPADTRPAQPRPDSDAPPVPPPAEPADAWTDGSVTVGGTAIDYCAVAGTLAVHPKDWDDAAPTRSAADKSDADDSDKSPPARAAIFYVAYLKRNGEPGARPITFLFNGGPGSATVWLHMGAFGPRRVDIADARHAAAAPYRLINNDQSLLDASDLVFIDAPGTGFSRVSGTDKERAFYGLDQDAYAFGQFITQFLTKYQRWNSPKYLFGESYGTMRAAVLVSLLQSDPGVDFNGVILLSQELASQLYPDQPKTQPGNDMPYLLALPTYAATAWYHQQPPGQRSADVPPSLLSDVERFAIGDYAAALAAGASLDPAARDAVVAKLHQFTGLPEDYIRQDDLRISADEFRQELLRDRGQVIGGTDTRFSGPPLDRMSRKALYDPSDTAIGSAYVTSFNDYARRVLKYKEARAYRPSVDDIGDRWDYSHQSPDDDSNAPLGQAANVIPDLAHAVKLNPLLKVQVNSGYFDLLTPYFQSKYEIRHLPIPDNLRNNIEFRCYPSGHMVYVASESLARLHTNVLDFIERTDNLPRPPGPRDAAIAGCAADR